jgi:hypothetical protein
MASDKRIAGAVTGTFSYLASAGLDSADLALDASGNVQASALYDPRMDAPVMGLSLA